MNVLDFWSPLAPEIKVAIGVLVAVQIVLDVIAFADLYKRPVSQLAIPNKWVWAAIILVVSTFGAVLYLVVGRKGVASVEQQPGARASVRAADAADLLYGEREDADKR
jgi:hypothetical protein